MTPATPMTPDTPVTLDNCDVEPIHIPGRIQSHGALLAFDLQGRLSHASANAGLLLGPLPAVGKSLGSAHLGPPARGALAAALAAGSDAADGPTASEVDVHGRSFDLIVHRSGDSVVLEFECQPEQASQVSAFALKAHRGMDRLRRLKSVQALLDAVVAEVRELTGFDRVMAYRFRHDDSGDIVAESCVDALEPFLHRRYPASDIPAQARRLYVINTLRLIADVASQPVDVAGPPGPPLDMSHCVLRSVSPVHIEYLSNMGVKASMSISIVIHGKLWGMLACHHMVPRQVPYAVRMACDVLAQVLAANLQSVLAAEHGERITAAASLRARAIEQLLHLDDALPAVRPLLPALCETFACGAAMISEDGKLALHGGVSEPAARTLLQWLAARPDLRPGELLALSTLGADAPLAAAMGVWCGVLALRFDTHGWLVLLRKEEVETILWGGVPEKEYKVGPLGPRLTPRASFDIWRQTVRGHAVPWDAAELEIARQLLDEMLRATSARNAELNRARTQLMAVLGHDLRDPLNSISLAASVLQTGEKMAHTMGQRIQTSSTRMQRLVSQVLDISRLQGGMGLGFRFEAVDLRQLVADLVEESRVSHPETTFTQNLPVSLKAEVDADRIAQLMANLLSNARHHGTPGEPILVQLAERDGMVELEVSNHGAEIPADVAASLYSPFKRSSMGNPRNRRGLGLGLYIAREVVIGHGGSLEYTWAEPYVVFTAIFPARRPDASDA
jgi:light-regulated signal transduction histidine kinase (bacteriophytochrome)